MFLVRQFTIDSMFFVLLRSVFVARNCMEIVWANRCSFNKVEKMQRVLCGKDKGV